MQMTPAQQRNAMRIYAMPFARLYPALLAKAERKGRGKAEVDRVIEWLTGYDAARLARALEDGRSVEQFFARAPAMNPGRERVTGVVCGVRIEQVAEPLMRDIRILDKLIDELARGRPMERILRRE